MTADELLSQAWKAVEASGVPPSLQELAFKEAVDFLRSATGSARTPRSSNQFESAAEPGSESLVDEDTFFSQLASESGEAEDDLRDILHLTADRTVHVTPPSKDLGKNVAEQARTVIALVAAARAKGLGEKPVSAEAVRQEAERKHCYQSNNFATNHLGPMRGFNAGATRNEIVLTSKWVEDFTGALNRLHSRPAAQE